jgi:flagellin-like hook-associated protein FlgL
VFSRNVDSNGNNTVSFSVNVNGVQYTSQDIYLQNSVATTPGDKNTIKAGTVLTFQSASGPKDGNGAFTNSAFQLTFGGTDVTLANVTSTAAGQNSLNSVVETIQGQLNTITIGQDRSLALTQINPSSSDHRITAAIGTILEGLRGFDSVGSNRLAHNYGDVRLSSELYGDTGTHGDITSFTVSRLTDTITTTIGGQTFTAYLNADNAPTSDFIKAFGVGDNGSYNTSTKTLTLGSGTVGESAKLRFYSDTPEDGRVVTIDLGNVAKNISQININTTEGERALANALNAVFDVAENDSLSFQVGVESTDKIGVSIGSAKTASLYLDNDGVSRTLTIATLAQSIEASEALDNAINKVISLISDVSAAITAFNSSIQNNQTSIQNADAARSNLLDTDYTVESTRFAESRVRVDAATAVLTQVNARIQNLLQLLQQ